MYLYRYEIEYKADGESTALHLRAYQVVKTTAAMYFIEPSYGKQKRVLKEAMNKFAYASKADALDHFKRRTENRIRWYDYWQKNCKVALILADRISGGDFDRDLNNELYNKL